MTQLGIRAGRRGRAGGHPIKQIAVLKCPEVIGDDCESVGLQGLSDLFGLVDEMVKLTFNGLEHDVIGTVVREHQVWSGRERLKMLVAGEIGPSPIERDGEKPAITVPGELDNKIDFGSSRIRSFSL